MSRWLFLTVFFFSVQIFAHEAVGPGEEMPWTPIQFQVYPGVEFYPPSVPVYGINVAGIGGGSYLAGLSVHLFQQSTEAYGLQLGGASMANRSGGLQFSLFNSAPANSGVQLGLVNLSGKSAPGTDGEESGVQLGIFNSASGGFQFGLLNYNANSAVPWMILLNWSF